MTNKINQDWVSLTKRYLVKWMKNIIHYNPQYASYEEIAYKIINENTEFYKSNNFECISVDEFMGNARQVICFENSRDYNTVKARLKYFDETFRNRAKTETIMRTLIKVADDAMNNAYVYYLQNKDMMSKEELERCEKYFTNKVNIKTQEE